MTRPEAIRFIATYPRAIISVSLAREISNALGIVFDMLLYIAPDLVRSLHGRVGWTVYLTGAPSDLVQVSDLGATVCRYMGLYADGDHALQSPHGTPGKQADYVGQRAAIRLARHWWGEPGVRDLRQDCPRLPKVLLRERPYKP